MQGDQIRGHVNLLVLAVLDGGAQHGYGVIAAMKERSGGAIVLPEGSAYPALQRLERSGHVTSDWDERGPKRRRVYRLTLAGKKALAEARDQWGELRTAIDQVVGE